MQAPAIVYDTSLCSDPALLLDRATLLPGDDEPTLAPDGELFVLSPAGQALYWTMIETGVAEITLLDIDAIMVRFLIHNKVWGHMRYAAGGKGITFTRDELVALVGFKVAIPAMTEHHFNHLTMARLRRYAKTAMFNGVLGVAHTKKAKGAVKPTQHSATA
jgi:hypothetical protein